MSPSVELSEASQSSQFEGSKNALFADDVRGLVLAKIEEMLEGVTGRTLGGIAQNACRLD
jgi:hypothetical protein